MPDRRNEEVAEGTFAMIRARYLLKGQYGFLRVGVLCLVQSHEFKQHFGRLLCPLKGWDILIGVLALKPSVDLPHRSQKVYVVKSCTVSGRLTHAAVPYLGPFRAVGS